MLPGAIFDHFFDVLDCIETKPLEIITCQTVG